MPVLDKISNYYLLGMANSNRVDPKNQDARNLEADALEQLGYQAESGPWRNFYLTGAQELRNGVVKGPTPNTASPAAISLVVNVMLRSSHLVRS